MIRTLALIILFAPYALGQSGYLQGCRVTSDKNESKYVSFEHEQKEWQKFLCKTNYPKKPIDLT